MKIFIFGPSCGGKSTLSQALHWNFGKEWAYLDRDEWVEAGHATDETVDALIDQKLANSKEHFIIDTQIPWRDKKADELYILVFAPLAKLLERDNQRTLYLNRTETRAKWAREFVIATYHQLLDEKEHPKIVCDAAFDSSITVVKEEIEKVRELASTLLKKI